MNGKIEISDLELVAKWDSFIRQIKALEPPEKNLLHDWALWLEKWPIPVEEEILAKFRRLANLEATFFSFKEHLTTLLLSLRESDPYHNLGQIRFSSIESAAALPAAATLILGLDEGAFPRREERSSFDLLAGASSGSRSRAIMIEIYFWIFCSPPEKTCLSSGLPPIIPLRSSTSF